MTLHSCSRGLTYQPFQWLCTCSPSLFLEKIQIVHTHKDVRGILALLVRASSREYSLRQLKIPSNLAGSGGSSAQSDQAVHAPPQWPREGTARVRNEQSEPWASLTLYLPPPTNLGAARTAHMIVIQRSSLDSLMNNFQRRGYTVTVPGREHRSYY